MKTKLLKKVRNNYSIVYCKNGYTDDGGYFVNGEYIRIVSNYWMEGYDFPVDNNYTEVYETAYKTLVKMIRRRFNKYGTRRKKNSRQIKLWWK